MAVEAAIPSVLTSSLSDARHLTQHSAQQSLPVLCRLKAESELSHTGNVFLRGYDRFQGSTQPHWDHPWKQIVFVLNKARGTMLGKAQPGTIDMVAIGEVSSHRLANQAVRRLWLRAECPTTCDTGHDWIKPWDSFPSRRPEGKSGWSITAKSRLTRPTSGAPCSGACRLSTGLDFRRLSALRLGEIGDCCAISPM